MEIFVSVGDDPIRDCAGIVCPRGSRGEARSIKDSQSQLGIFTERRLLFYDVH